MTVDLLTGITITDDNGNVQLYTYSTEHTDLKPAEVRKGKSIGTVDDEEWDIEVFLYNDQYYVIATFNPPGRVTRLVPVPDSTQAMKLLEEWHQWYQPNGVPNGYEQRLTAFLKKHKGT